MKILFKLPHRNEVLSLALFQSQEYNLVLHKHYGMLAMRKQQNIKVRRTLFD